MGGLCPRHRRRPRPNPPYTRRGGRTATIAVVPDGATCGFLGATGITDSFWRVLEDGVAGAASRPGAVRRNYWLFDRELGGLDPFVTGFAIANRFVAMDRRPPVARSTARPSTRSARRLPRSPPPKRLDWRVSLADGTGVPGTRYPGDRPRGPCSTRLRRSAATPPSTANWPQATRPQPRKRR